LDYLKKQGLIDEEEKRITNKGAKFAKKNEVMCSRIREISRQFAGYKEIEKHVYNKYPEYTEKSKLVEHKEEKQKGKYTIGYEGKSFDFFLNQLIQNKINKLIDVRKNPISMKRGFSKETLKTTLEKVQIEYEHVPRLGIDSEKRQNLETKDDYKKLFEEYRKSLPKLKNELNYIAKAGNKERVAIMCFEREPERCHRGQISDYLGGFEHL
jgi:uncharacterized protein (DUF488 family)